MYLHRNLTRHGGGTFEWFIGPRFLYIEDTFGVTTGTDSADGVVPSFMGGSAWGSQAINNIIGGEIGLRWFKKQGRWMFSTEGRFMAGLNRQNINVQSNLVRNPAPGGSTATNPLYLGSSAASHQAYATEFSPAVELRLEGRYQFTRALSFHAGWTGIWVDNIARGTSVIDYTVSSTGVGYNIPAMGVDMSGNKQNLIMNGLTLGFDFNR